jgi:hypothetical protein
MKKIIISTALIFGLTQLTAAEKSPITGFGTFISSITPQKSLFAHRHLLAAYKNPLLPSFLKTPEIVSALEKYRPHLPSLTYQLEKVGVALSLATIGYTAYRFYFPASPAVHCPQIGVNLPITQLNLTIQIQKNGWTAPLILPIDTANDVTGYAIFLRELQRDLTNPEKVTVGETSPGNSALLQESQTYTFTISGHVTYQGTKRYELQKEQVIVTLRPSTQGPWNSTLWSAAFWKKNIATRIASVWPALPGDLIDDRITTYHATITDTATNQQLHSLSASPKENFKEQVIEAVASEIYADTVKTIEIKMSATAPKDHFALAALHFAINSPGSDQAIYEGLQQGSFHPDFKTAQVAYATQLWTISCEQPLVEITALQPFTTQEKISTGIVWMGAAGATALALKKLTDADFLSPALSTGLGIAALTKMHAVYAAHKKAYH